MNNKTVSGQRIEQAVDVIRRGGIVAFPTETYYGLAVDPFNEHALARLFEVKGRPSLKPVLLLVSGQGQLKEVAGTVPGIAQTVMSRFWPGPLTIVLPAKSSISTYVTGNTGTVGVRLSPHPVAEALLKACGKPLTATSANKAGCTPAVTASDVLSVFHDQIDLVIDGGRTPGEKGSTLIGFEGDTLFCIREGSVPFAEIENALQKD